METKKKVYFHGELVITECEKSEVTGKKMSTAEDIKLAASEVTGNDHMLKAMKGLTVFDDQKADRFFVTVPREAKAEVFCKIADRHTTLELPAGTYKIGKAQEFDHISRAKRNVLD
jgi:hypothetical protein